MTDQDDQQLVEEEEPVADQSSAADQSKLRQARDEARKYRLQLQQMKRELAAAQEKMTGNETESQTLARQLKQIQDELHESRLQGMRLEVGAKYGLSADLSRRVRGEDLESMSADAEELAELFKQQQRPITGAERPPPDAGQHQNGQPPTQQNVNEWLRRKLVSGG